MIWRIMYISEELRWITVSKVCVILHIMLILRFWCVLSRRQSHYATTSSPGRFSRLWSNFGGGAGPFPTPPPKPGKSALGTRLITLSERRRREGSNWFALALLAEQLRRLLIQQLIDYLFSPLQVTKSELILSLITEGIWRNSREGKWSRNVSCNCFWDRYWGRLGGQWPTFDKLKFQHDSEALGSNFKFFNTPLSRNSQRRLEHKENQTKCRQITRKPRIHVWILICRTWAIFSLSLVTVPEVFAKLI